MDSDVSKILVWQKALFVSSPQYDENHSKQQKLQAAEEYYNSLKEDVLQALCENGLYLSNALSGSNAAVLTGTEEDWQKAEEILQNYPDIDVRDNSVVALVP